MAEKNKFSFIKEALDRRRSKYRFRTLIPYKPETKKATLFREKNELINFSSNDYLGLSKHPEVIKRSCLYAKEYGAGSTASRLISGTYDIHFRLEEKLASAFGGEAALLFNSGFQANSTIISTLTDRRSLILADKLSHNSLLQGSLLSRATFQRFNHNDPDHLEELLKKAQKKSYSRILIITETVFSMDGDRCPVEEIARLSGRYNALLYVDDAHAVGVWGRKGRGLAAEVKGVDIILGTCGKAFGAFGAYVVCSQEIKDYLINCCPGFIYTTALPPAVIGAIDASLDIIPTLDKERTAYHKFIECFRNHIQSGGFDTGSSSTQIIPVLVGDEQETLNLASSLEKQGFLATAIRPPTVPEQSSRIRLTLSLRHTDEQMSLFLTSLIQWKRDKS